METIKALLELLPGRLPYILILFGMLALIAAVVPFKIDRAGWTVRNPATRAARLSLLGIGVATGVGGLYAATKIDDAEINRLSKKRISSFFSYVTISGTEADCAAGRCRLAFRNSVLLVAPKGQGAMRVE